MDADGSNETNLTNTLDPADGEGKPAWSPDGDKIAYSALPDGGDWEIYVMDADGTDQTNITDNEEFDVDPTWSADGSKIAFHSLRGGDDAGEIYVMDVQRQRADEPDRARGERHVSRLVDDPVGNRLASSPARSTGRPGGGT